MLNAPHPEPIQGVSFSRACLHALRWERRRPDRHSSRARKNLLPLWEVEKRAAFCAPTWQMVACENPLRGHLSDAQRFLHAHDLLHNCLFQALVLRVGDAQRLLDGRGQLVQHRRAQREPRLMRQHICRVN